MAQDASRPRGIRGVIYRLRKRLHSSSSSSAAKDAPLPKSRPAIGPTSGANTSHPAPHSAKESINEPQNEISQHPAVDEKVGFIFIYSTHRIDFLLTFPSSPVLRSKHQLQKSLPAGETMSQALRLSIPPLPPGPPLMNARPPRMNMRMSPMVKTKLTVTAPQTLAENRTCRPRLQIYFSRCSMATCKTATRSLIHPQPLLARSMTMG